MVSAVLFFTWFFKISSEFIQLQITWVNPSIINNIIIKNKDVKNISLMIQVVFTKTM